MPSTLGRVIRLPLRLIPRSAVVRVLKGPNKGFRWVVGASTHGCWLGSFEGSKPSEVQASIPRGSVVFDIGANVGYFTLLGSRAVGPEGHVYAFEPLPTNLDMLRRHIALNGLSNATVIDAAVSDRAGTARFARGHDASSMAHFDDRGEFEVRTISIDDEVEAGRLPTPGVIKMDIEGAEAMALAGARRTLETARPLVFLATHGAEVHARCLEILRGAGYEIESMDDKPVEQTREVKAKAGV